MAIAPHFQKQMSQYVGIFSTFPAALEPAARGLTPEFARRPVAATAQEILGGVRSACTYVGARRLRELSKRTTFVRVTQQLNEVFGKA